MEAMGRVTRGARGVGGPCAQERPEVNKVCEIARFAGEAWRALAPEHKSRFEQLSATEKVGTGCLLGPAARGGGGGGGAFP